MRELLFILTTTAGQVTLTNAPDGWDESMIEWGRSEKYWGVFRSFTIPLKFVKDGAEAIRREFYTYGTAGTGDLIIQRLNKLTLQYSNAYVGTLDFGTFKDTDINVEVNVMDSGLAKILKENGETEYEVFARSLDVLDPYIEFWSTRTGVSVGNWHGGVDVVDVVKRLLDAMTGGGYTAGTYGFKSDLLDGYKATGNEGDTTVTPIVMAKGLTFSVANANPVGNFSISFADLYKSLVTFTGCGVGIEVIDGVETLVIEPRTYFFVNDSVALALGSVKNINVSVASKLVFNRLKIGWPTKDYQNRVKNEEPNATSFWKSPNTTNGNELDMVGKVRADSIGILDIIDSQSDGANDDIFFCELDWDANYGGYWRLNTSSKAKQTGSAGEWYVGNATLTPRRCILANQGWLESCHYGHSGDSLSFTAGENDLYNIEVKVWGNGGFGTYMKERNSVTLGGPLYFQPLTIEFEAALPVAMIDTLNSHATELFSFTYEGEIYYGYVMNVKAKLAGRGSQKITLLSAFNDLTSLIR